MKAPHDPSSTAPLESPVRRHAVLGSFFQDTRCVSDRQTNPSGALPQMSASEGYFELHTAFPVPSAQRDAVIRGFANFTKDGSDPNKTFGKQLEFLAGLEPASPVGMLLAQRAKTAAQGQPANPTSFFGWNIALRFGNIAADATDENGAPLGPDQYHRHYSAGTTLVVDVTVRVPLGTDVATWGSIRDRIETNDPVVFAGVKADLIAIAQARGLGTEAENLIAALTLQ